MDLEDKKIFTNLVKIVDGDITDSEFCELLGFAENNNSYAQCAVGIYYEKLQQYEKAIYWLKKSALQCSRIIQHQKFCKDDCCVKSKVKP